jgi:Apea-like HEPN
MASDKRVGIDRLRGVAFFDSEKDAPITSLRTFASAVAAVLHIPDFVSRFGPDQATRIVLQFVYQYFERAGSVKESDAAFEGLWADFAAEVDKPYWVTRGVANLRHFTTPDHPLTLGEGISIRGRNPDDLLSLGFQAAIFERLVEDWGGFGSSSFVLVSENVTLKDPANVILLDSASVPVKATRAVTACRLAAAGSISIGPMWIVRASRFNVGMGGLSRVGASIPSPPFGIQFEWSEAVSRAYKQTCSELAGLDTAGYGRSPGNLQIALGSFMATYDRWPPGRDSQLLDAITALEAILGTDNEISFRLAFRVASLLAADGNERTQLMGVIRGFYDTRSRLVHGGILKQKHQTRLDQIEVLRSHVRRLLRAFVRFAADSKGTFTRAILAEHLDEILVNGVEREKLRFELGLDRN